MGNKYGYNPGGGMGGMGGGGGMQNLMKQAQQMQQKLAEAQQQLEDSVVTGSAGGNLVSVEMNGKKVISSIKIDPNACDRDDVEMLEDLVIAAINDAYGKVDALESEIMAPFAAMKGLL